MTTMLRCEVALAIALTAGAAVPAAQQHPKAKEPTQKASAAQKASKGTSSLVVGAATRNFAVFAAQGNMAEVELANVAKERSSNPDVKQFADRMLTDHRDAEQTLDSLAQQKQITLPPAPDATHVALKQQLEGMQGSAFDRTYMDAMVKDHNRTVAAFEQESRNGKDPDFKSFAERTLPTLQQHLQMARKIDATLNREK